MAKEEPTAVELAVKARIEQLEANKKQLENHLIELIGVINGLKQAMDIIKATTES